MIYGLPTIVTYHTKNCIFQYKLLSNALYLNQKLYQFGIVFCSTCSFCNVHDETHCISFMNVCNQPTMYSAEKIDLLVFTPESATFAFVDVQDQN